MATRKRKHTDNGEERESKVAVSLGNDSDQRIQKQVRLIEQFCAHSLTSERAVTVVCRVTRFIQEAVGPTEQRLSMIRALVSEQDKINNHAKLGWMFQVCMSTGVYVAGAKESMVSENMDNLLTESGRDSWFLACESFLEGLRKAKRKRVYINVSSGYSATGFASIAVHEAGATHDDIAEVRARIRNLLFDYTDCYREVNIAPVPELIGPCAIRYVKSGV